VRLTFTGVLTIVLFSISFAQQSIDLVTLSLRYAVPRPYKSQLPGKATEVAGFFNVKVPIVLNESTIWYNDLLYGPALVFNSEPLPSSQLDPIAVHGFILQTGLVKRLKNGDAIQLLFVPRFMTDFIDVSARNWQLGGIALYEKRYSKKLMMRFGTLYNMELFGPIITPLVHLEWLISDKWSIIGLLPIYAKLNYRVNENLNVGISHFGFTTTYRLGELAYRNDYIERSSIDFSLYLRQRIRGNLYIEGRFGHSITRKYSQYAEDQKMDLKLIVFNFNDNRVQKNQDFKDGIIANIRFVYNLPLPQ
jgi:Domain of unknown function (DUF6268)